MLTPTGGGYSSGNEERSQSAFPIPTPDRLGPLTDLLEEDDQTPLDSRENSGRRRTDWSFLPRPKTPGSTTSSSESYVSSYLFLFLKYDPSKPKNFKSHVTFSSHRYFEKFMSLRKIYHFETFFRSIFVLVLFFS